MIWRGPTAAAPGSSSSIASARLASAQRGPAGLVAGSIPLAGSWRTGPLALRSGFDPVHHVWS